MWNEQCREYVQSAVDTLNAGQGDAAAAELLEKAFRLDMQAAPSAQGFRVGCFSATYWRTSGRTERCLATVIALRDLATRLEDELTAHDRVSLLWSDFSLRHEWLVACDSLDAVLAELQKAGERDFNGGCATACYAAARLHMSRGHFAEGLAQCERGWTEHVSPNGEYGHRHRIAFLAALCCLEMGRLDEADRWMAQTDEDDDHEESACPVRRNEVTEYRILRALAAGDAMGARLQADVAAGAGAGAGTSVALARAHALMADPALGDPGAPDHPARAVLRRLCRPENPDERFRRRLAIADLRLAALRHADTSERRRRAVHALAMAGLAGTKVDAALGGDWRGRQVAELSRALVTDQGPAG